MVNVTGEHFDESGGATAADHISQASAPDSVNQAALQEAQLLIGGGTLTHEQYTYLQQLFSQNPGLEMRLAQAIQAPPTPDSQLQQSQGQSPDEKPMVVEKPPISAYEKDDRIHNKLAHELADAISFNAAMHSNASVGLALKAAIENGMALGGKFEPINQVREDINAAGTGREGRVSVMHDVAAPILGLTGKHKDRQHDEKGDYRNLVDPNEYPDLAMTKNYGTGKFPPDPNELNPGNAQNSNTPDKSVDGPAVS